MRMTGRLNALVSILSTFSVVKCNNHKPVLRGLGRDDAEMIDTDSRIVGGVDAPRNYYNHQVAILAGSAASGWGFVCGGSLVASNMVICAAHCTAYAKAVAIKRYVNSNTGNPEEEIIEICQTTNHPKYGTAGSAFDMSVYKLCKHSTKTTTADYITLNSSSDIPQSNNKLTVTGWGALKEGGPQAVNLQKVVLDYIPNAACNVNYSGAISQDMMCAGIPQVGGKDACQGDSGGPLIMDGGTATSHVLLGVVSWGAGCAAPQFPGVYARVSFFKDWLQTMALEYQAFPSLKFTSNGKAVESADPIPKPSTDTSTLNTLTGSATTDSTTNNPPPPESPSTTNTATSTTSTTNTGSTNTNTVTTNTGSTNTNTFTTTTGSSNTNNGSTNTNTVTTNTNTATTGTSNTITATTGSTTSTNNLGCCLLINQDKYQASCSTIQQCNLEQSDCLTVNTCGGGLERQYYAPGDEAWKQVVAKLEQQKQEAASQQSSTTNSQQQSTSTAQPPQQPSTSTTQIPPGQCCWQPASGGCMSRELKPECTLTAAKCQTDDCGNGQWYADILQIDPPEPIVAPAQTQTQSAAQSQSATQTQTQAQAPSPITILITKGDVLTTLKGTKYVVQFNYEGRHTSCSDSPTGLLGKNNVRRECEWCATVDNADLTLEQKLVKIHDRCESYGNLCPLTCGFCKLA